ncbi:hypothetical protein MLD38_017627 [Melastoma candidum]|uniref:Uncharacterized protein n=1 Tax=Melastoma candidum TaxID=119954 RepID=A0ACB9QR93_9MYRT|nr:hypothetical protein MLD38_017627 [Melastoma candidum]
MSENRSMNNVLRLRNQILSLLELPSNAAYVKIIHGHMLRTNLISDPFAAKRLINFCANPTFRTSLLDYSHSIFLHVRCPDLFMYNALIRGYSAGDSLERSIELFVSLCRDGMIPDDMSFACTMKACSRLGWFNVGCQLQGSVVKLGFEDEVHVVNAMLHMYCTFEDVESASRIFGRMKWSDVVSWTTMILGLCNAGDAGSARYLFDRMPQRNLYSWSVMINGYMKSRFYERAVELFDMLRMERVRANEAVMVGIVSSCGHLGSIEKAERAYSYLLRINLPLSLKLGTAVIDMFARCGMIEKALQVFEGLPEKDVLTWTTLISGFARHGDAEGALGYFSKMLHAGVIPVDITFTAVLSACSRSGMVEHGFKIFESMTRDYGIQPRLEHYGCMVDLFGRAGKLEQAERFVLEMPVKPNTQILGALIAACRIHRNTAIAERIGKIAIDMLPEHSGYYVLMSNIYARANKWDNVDTIRHEMREKGVIKELGYSFIEINGRIHRFTMGDRSHPEMEKIEAKWLEILTRIRSVGYTGNTDDTMFDVDEEEKETAVYQHSEKLAIAYGMMRIRADLPIRIVKNLRVCDDCHRATKFISQVFERELIVRDRKRFHHFKGGACSCKDFW